jgi:hypothetical protein
MDYLVVWERDITMLARLFGPLGEAKSPEIRLGALTEEVSMLLRVLYDGRTYIVFRAVFGVDGQRSLLAQRVARDGSVLDQSGIPLSIPNLRDAASDGLGRTLLAYDRSDGRVGGRFLLAADPGAFPSTCGPVGPPPPQCSFTVPARSTRGFSMLALGVAVLAVRRRHMQRASACC